MAAKNTAWFREASYAHWNQAGRRFIMEINLEQTFGRPRVVLIDDDANRMSFVSTLLKKHGADVSAAFPSDREFFRFRPDFAHCILIDIDAFETHDVRLLNRNVQVEHFPPVILLATSGDARSEHFFQHSGVFEVLAHESQPSAIIAGRTTRT